MMLMERINHIKQKLAGLKSLDKGFSIFGSGRHRYELYPTLSEEEICQLETDNDIVISGAYREILKSLGNGGAGPGYGFEKLSLKHINPPYIGTDELLRNWDDPQEIGEEMVDSDEISGYIKLLDYGCGMQTGIIVKGKEIGSLIYFDSDERFEKIANRSILDYYDEWLDYCLIELTRVQQKLGEMSLKEVVDTEWERDNFDIKDMILSLIDAAPMKSSRTGNELNAHLEKEYEKWSKKNLA